MRVSHVRIHAISVIQSAVHFGQLTTLSVNFKRKEELFYHPLLPEDFYFLAQKTNMSAREGTGKK